MTEDTKKALEIIQPLAEELRINVSADDRRLYLGRTVIGISCNSTYATVMEALGYIFLTEYPRFRKVLLSKSLQEAIKRYWVKEAKK